MNNHQVEKKPDTKVMAKAGFKAANQIMDGWGCSTKDKQKIMRIAPSTYHKFKVNPETISLDSDQLERLSYIVNIHASLRIVFDNPENVKGFMALENHNPYFNGRTPLSIIRDGKFSHIYEVFCRIDSLRSGLWG
ncbi:MULTISPECIES: antitoxin Xre-like helix-turn-helix domain-containing protein [Vibrio]|uniref:DUF2384 domain-containing protein n=1 Tax=Vibrio casei TaxID=673372 RepID=A0A368LI17_9VIBR|nr:MULTISPECIES: antitoxin Xre-like helix-turn-helix domain-containing protein [Vibrio]RCS70265.1 DUF2384 domain-containing protein [Vibrio casei]SJN19473.1 hypothetical protein FM109_02400 [Vibrio casei]HBV76408.1 DUF2384 domain-containing protein [Vibrio sp.]